MEDVLIIWANVLSANNQTKACIVEVEKRLTKY